MTEAKTFGKQRFSEVYFRQTVIKKSIGTMGLSSQPWDVRELTVRLCEARDGDLAWGEVFRPKEETPPQEEGRLYTSPYPRDSSLFSPIHAWYTVGA